jgi:hypothetical protein
MKGSFMVYVALLCSTLIAGIPVGSMAGGAPSPPSGLQIGETAPTPAPTPEPIVSATPPGNDGLLSGMTPGNYKVPSGWSKVTADDFEGTNPAGTGQGWYDGTQDATFSHSGSKSYRGSYTGDQSTVRWLLGSSKLGTFSEVYLSFYEYIESQALFNDEFFLARFSRSDPFHEVILDWYWARNDAGSPAFNGTKATLYAVPQGVRFGNVAGKTATVPKGAWVQWEIHYRPNSPGVADGFIRVYKDGTLFTSAANVNLNGTSAMSGVTAIQIAGVYTKLTWATTSPPNCPAPISCSSAPGIGTDLCYTQVYKNTLGANSFADPLCSPKDPAIPSFKRFIDDIIVLKK